MKLSHPIQLLFLICLLLSGFWYIISASTGLLLIAAVVAGCNAIFSRQTFQVYSLTKLMVAYLAWLLIVTFTSTVPNASMMMLSILAGMPIMYLVATNLPNFTAIWQQLRLIIFAIAVGFALMAIWQVMHHLNADGPLSDRNAFAALLNLIWFPAVFLLVSALIASKHRQVLYRQAIFLGLGLFIISLALFATTSRAGLLTWAILLPFMLWAIYKHTNSKKQITIVLIIAALAYTCSAQFLHSSIADRSFQIGPSAKAGQMSNDASIEARLLMWQSTIKMAQAHPFSGTGWDTFRAYYPAYRSSLEYTTTGRYAHNDYLQFASEGGFIAMLLILGLALGVMLHLRKCLQHKIDANYFEAAALLLGVIAIFIQASVNFIFYFPFLSIVAGLYLAYAAKLIETPQVKQLPIFLQIKPFIKILLAGVLIIFFAPPYLSNLVTQACLLQPQFGMKILNYINPKLTPYKLAQLITIIRPQEALAQLTILNSETAMLLQSNIDALGINMQTKILNNTLSRYDYVRSNNAYNPELGVQEVKLLIYRHTLLDSQDIKDFAYIKAHQILKDNFKMIPLHTDSIIMLARLQVAEGNSDEALNTLDTFINKVPYHLDQQFIYLEILRQFAAPKVYAELDEIELQLRQVVSNNSELKEKKQTLIDFYTNVDAKLNQMKAQIKSEK